MFNEKQLSYFNHVDHVSITGEHVSSNPKTRIKDGCAQPWGCLSDDESRSTSDEDDEEQKNNDEEQ